MHYCIVHICTYVRKYNLLRENRLYNVHIVQYIVQCTLYNICVHMYITYVKYWYVVCTASEGDDISNKNKINKQHKKCQLTISSASNGGLVDQAFYIFLSLSIFIFFFSIFLSLSLSFFLFLFIAFFSLFLFLSRYLSFFLSLHLSLFFISFSFFLYLSIFLSLSYSFFLFSLTSN